MSGFDGELSMAQVGEPVLVQAFIAKAFVEQFDMGVMIELSRLGKKR